MFWRLLALIREEFWDTFVGSHDCAYSSRKVVGFIMNRQSEIDEIVFWRVFGARERKSRISCLALEDGNSLVRTSANNLP